VSTLLTLAGRDDEENKGHDFPKVLLDQIRRLREQLDEEERESFFDRFHTNKGSVQKVKLPLTPPSMKSHDFPNRPGPHFEESILTTEGWRQKPMGSFIKDIPTPADQEFTRPHEARSERAMCFWTAQKSGPNGKMVPVEFEDLPEDIRARMLIERCGSERE
jgi:hypothetical protein